MKELQDFEIWGWGQTQLLEDFDEDPADPEDYEDFDDYEDFCKDFGESFEDEEADGGFEDMMMLGPYEFDYL